MQHQPGKSADKERNLRLGTEFKPLLSVWGLSSAATYDVELQPIDLDASPSVAVGENHFYVVTKKGAIYGFGDNLQGQVFPSGPVKYSQLTKLAFNMKAPITKFFCGTEFTFCLAGTQLYAWGLNITGQLGLGHCNKVVSPELVRLFGDGETGRNNGLSGNEETVAQVACGSLHTLLLSTRGRLFATGFNQTFALGTSEKTNLCTFKEIFIKAGSSDSVTRICCGVSHSAAIVGDKVYVWGKFSKDQTGRSRTPVQVKQVTDAIDISAGLLSTAILTAQGEVFVLGKLLKGTEGVIPKRIELNSRMKYISHGLKHLIFASQNFDQIWGLGSNVYGQVDPFNSDCKLFKPTALTWLHSSRPSAILCGGHFSVCVSLQPVRGKTLLRDTKLRELERATQERA